MPGENVPIFPKEFSQRGVYIRVQLCPDGGRLFRVRWVDLEFYNFVRWFKGGGLGSLIEYRVVSVHRSAQHGELLCR